MKTLLKLILFLAFLAITLLVGAALYLQYYFNPNDFKGQITAQVQRSTGRALSIGGDIQLAYFPWLGVRVSSVAISNAKGFGETPMASVKEAEIRVKVLPLFKKRLEMDTIVLRGLDLNLARDKQGRTNWQDLVSGAAAEPRQQGQGEASPALAALAVGGVQLSDGHVVWDDRSSGAHYAVDELNLSTGALASGSPTGLDLSFNLKASNPPVGAKVRLTGVAALDTERKTLQISGLHLEVDGSGQAVPMDTARLRLSTDLALDGLQGTAKLAGLKLTVDGRLLGSDIDTHVALGGELGVDTKRQRLSAPHTDLSVQIKGGGFPQGLDAHLRTDLSADLAKQAFALVNLNVEAAGLKATGELSGEHLTQGGSASGRLQLQPFSPRELLARLGQAVPETADPNVLTRADAQLALKLHGGGVTIEPLSLALDDTKLTGSVSIQDFASLRTRFQLIGDALDLDRYLPPAKEGQTKPVGPGTAAAGAAGQLPLEALRGLNLDGSIRLGKLKVSNLRIADIKLTVKAADGQVSLQPINAALYEGLYSGNIGLDARGPVLQFSVDESLKGVQAGPLLKDLQGKDTLRGTGNLSVRVTGRGKTAEEIPGTLNGQLTFAFLNGAVKGINIAEMLRQAQAKLEGKSLPQSNEPNETDFTELKGTVHIQNGVARNDDLSAKSPLLRVGGEGQADLSQRRMDYLLHVSLVGTLRGQGGESLDKLQHVDIPLRIKGPFDDLAYSLDLDKLLKDRAKQELEKKLQEKLQGQLLKGSNVPSGGDAKEELLKKGLESLFKKH